MSSIFPLTLAAPFEKSEHTHTHSLNQFSFPSPPLSTGCATDTTPELDLDLDFESFTNSTASFDLALGTAAAGDLTLGLSPADSTTSPSTIASGASVITPSKSTLLDVDFDPAAAEISTVQALSEHHLLRYLHYKALAEQSAPTSAPAVAAVDRIVSVDEQASLDSLFSLPSFDLEQVMADGNQSQNQVYKPVDHNMLSFQHQPVQHQQFYIPQQHQQPQPQIPTWSTMSYQPQQQPVQMQNQQAMYHAQAQAHAQAHMQAHNDAAARARSLSMHTFYGSSSTRSIDTPWSRSSLPSLSAPSTMSSISSASVPSTPMGLGMHKSASTGALALGPIPVLSQQPIAERDEYDELGDIDDEGEDELSPAESSQVDLKPAIPSMPLTNLHGGGRGYIPGQTPDDPKKRHKCHVCGRAFARAFNLKSHVQTHNPMRSKPHVCPHPTCNRGFSRLHDLERHRQGIHSDGPLADAKRDNVSPSVARAQGRMQRRAQSGGLI